MRRRRWNRAGEHPALRAFRAIEDAYYRVTARRRARVVARVRAALGRHLVPNHQVLRDFDTYQHTYGPTSMQNIAAGQGVRYLMPWEWVTHAFRSAWIFEFMVSQWICLCWPSWSHRWTLVPLALGMTGWRQHWAAQEAQAWVPRYLAPMVGSVPRVESVAVNRRGVGWWRVGWWQWRPDPVPAVAVDLTPLVVGAVLVLALAWPSVATAGVSFAALSANTVWEIRTTGAATNGGAFVTGASGTDWSQQNTAQYAVTDGVTNGTTTITSASANFGTDVVGNIMYVTGGTGSITADWYQITARTNSTTITVDRSTGLTTGTGVTLNIGGALTDPAIVASKVVATNTVWIKSGTYSVTSSSANVSGGCVSQTGVATYMEGYNSTRGDFGTAPTMQASGISTATLWTIAASDSSARNIAFDGNSLTSLRGFSSTVRSTITALSALNCTNSGFNWGGTVAMTLRATGCTTTGAGILISNTPTVLGSVAHDNTVHGFSLTGAGFCTRCIADTNTGASSDGFSLGVGGTAMSSSTAYGNGRDGIRFAGNSGVGAVSLCEGNGGYGFNNTGVANVTLTHCGGYNNTSGNTNGTFVLNRSFVTGSASFFTDAAGGDFSLNTTAGGGAAARAAGIPGVFPGISTTGHLDIGAAQHADPASSGGGIPVIGGNIIRVAS